MSSRPLPSPPSLPLPAAPALLSLPCTHNASAATPHPSPSNNVNWKGLDGRWVNERFNALLESGPKPTVAAIDGLCLGGGLEASMACNARVATAGKNNAISSSHRSML